jgi:putative phosphoserine phosphatase/1-acylglycerol-3-phosphate O-acyltransferase
MSDEPTPGTVAEIAASRRGKRTAAFFDLDGTIIHGFSAQVMTQDRLRRRDVKVAELLSLGRWGVNAGLGRGGFTELLETTVRALKGKTHAELVEMGERMFATKIADRIYPEMRELVAAHRARGHTVVLISSATTYQTLPIAEHLGIEHVECNELAVGDDGRLTGKLAAAVVWGETKAERALDFAAAHSIDMKRSYFYADGDEDAALMYHVGNPRPTNPRKGLESIAVKEGWPVTKFTSRGSVGTVGAVRNLVGMAALGPAAAGGFALGVLSGRKRVGVDFVVERWLDALFTSTGVTLDVQGEENLWVRRPAVFIFNHRNNMDVLMACKLVGRDFTSVGKKEATSNPLSVGLGKLIDAVFIDRDDTQGSIESMKPVQDAVRKGLSLVISPEGTRSATREVGAFKKGPFRIAMAAGVPIVPIVFRNADEIAPRNAQFMRPGTVDAIVLPPIPTDDWTVDDLPARIAAVRQAYIDTLANWGERGD